MKKGICERRNQYQYINQHHKYPKKYFGTKDNNKTVQLCLNCHAELHEQLPKEEQSKEFYETFTAKFIGIVILLVVLAFIII